MKRIHFLMAMLILSLIATDECFGQNESQILEGPYLGQPQPSLVPEAFAPGIVTTEHFEYSGVFTPDMNEFYLIRGGGKYGKSSFVVYRKKNNRWKESIISARVGQPFIAPNGRTLHLGSRYMVRTNDGWSEIKSLGPSFENIQIMRLTASSNETYVFDEIGSRDGDGAIRYSRLMDGKRGAPIRFGKEINTGKFNAHPFIAPDESYLIWDGRRESGYGNSDLYISFRQQDGSWGGAVNLGDGINTSAWEASASVTPDGKFLFFHREISPGNVDIYWVDAQVIEAFRPKF